MSDRPATRPNILLITADQWRGLSSSALTPNLAALAAEGTRFTRHYTATYPCGPARASLFTGLHPHKHRSVQNGVPLDARHPTLFTQARAAGYRPMLFGYTDITLDPRGRAPLDPDLGDYENLCPGIVPELLLTERATPWLAHLASRGHALPDPDDGRNTVFAQAPFGAPAIFDAADSETAFLTDRFLAWLRVAGAPPFFAHLSFIAPHPPFAAAAPYHALVDPAALPLPVRGDTPATEAAQHPLIAALQATNRVRNFLPGRSGLARDVDDATVQQTRAIYAGLVAEFDHHLGRVVAALRNSGRWDNTLIVVTADHGEMLFDHWMLGKIGYFDSAAHIPLILRDPAHPGGHVVDDVTESTDLMPTLLARIGVPVPRNCDGVSLLPFCAGTPPPAWRDEAHWSFDFRDTRDRRMETLLGLPSDWCNAQVVQTNRLKYVHFAALPPVLFDLAKDPQELRNVAQDPAYQALRLEGLERLLTWRQQHEDRTLTGLLCRDGKFSDQDTTSGG